MKVKVPDPRPLTSFIKLSNLAN